MLALLLAFAVLQNQPPQARLTVTPASVLVGATVTADGSATTDPGSPVGKQRWTYAFGDGQSSSGRGVVLKVTHAYGQAGNYTVTLMVTDSRGLTGSATAPGTVTSAAPPPDTTPPSTPTNLNPTLIQQTSFTITWSASTDANGIDKYHVYMTDTLVQTLSGTTTTANFTALTCATSYKVDVDASDPAGNTSAKATLTVSTATCSGPPPPVVNPTTAIFRASTDHATLVTRYELRIYPASGSIAVATQDLGKPAPDANNDITYDQLQTVIAGQPDGDYVGKAVAFGDGGSAESLVSNTFSISGSAPPPAGQPWNGVAQAVPGTVEFENYDLGGEGVAYHDTTATNDGGQYRTSEAVDLEATSDAPGGYNVGYIYPGEWINYTVNVTQAGAYTLGFRVSSPGPGGTFHLTVNGIDATGPLVIPDTGGWQVFTTVLRPGVNLAAGLQTWRLIFDANGASGYVGNFNFVSVQ